ncbi:MAG: cytochrome c3 family protein [Candidatus Krumholzibacteria bacterium]|jgi:hypothetical protein|nr:cytochrome c3 family protein [Candidatus Krumholzibacteria bacterium]MDP6668601.1 cytochrome c3 family protein [Candidatus Krumholzibacteria bacterium]MDP7021331.1 cytochrome c3 family protein [Candidatus Krumholzibacteria bacterium]
MSNPQSGFPFPRWTNAFRHLIPLLLLGGLVYGIVLIASFFSPKSTNIGYAPEQVIPYSHAMHAGELGIDCRYCHTGVETTTTAGIPSTDICMNCHQLLHVESPKLAPLRESFESGRPVEWTRVHDLPDFVFFRHSSHVQAGVSCVSCHGRVDEMERVEQVETLGMSWCLDCHRNPGPHLRPEERVTDLAWSPKDPEKTGSIIRAEKNIHPSESCSACHR